MERWAKKSCNDLFFLTKTLEGKLEKLRQEPLGFICDSKLLLSGIRVEPGGARNRERAGKVTNYLPGILKFPPQVPSTPASAFFSKTDSSPETSCVKKSGCSRIPQEGMGWGGAGWAYSFLWMRLAAGTLGWLAGWLAVRHKSPACTDVTLSPSAGGGPARQMARSRTGDGLSIKWHFLGGGEGEAPAQSQRGTQGTSFAGLGIPS